MTTGHNFWDAGVWSLMIELTILLVAMLTANMLRRLIKPLRQSLIPSSVLGGFLILIANIFYEKITGGAFFNKVTMETLTYHGLGLGFVAMALRSSKREKTKKSNTAVFDAGVTTVSSYLLQGILGLSITIGFFFLLGSWPASGLLLPMGFGQGPGQAYNWGHIYETATAYAPFRFGGSFGLTVAAMGFVSAGLGGVIYLHRIKKKGLVNPLLQSTDEEESLTTESISDKGEIPLSESLDKLTVQIGLVVLTYMAAYGVMYLISIGLDSLGGFFTSTVKPLIWGFNFLIGTVMAILVRNVLKGLTDRGRRQYLNNFMLARVSGVMFDLMVVASIAAINLTAFSHREFILPLLAVCIVGAVATYLQLAFISKRLYPEYPHEAFLSLYGMLTGTASTGVILLREIDPLFKTPAANNLVYQQLWAIVFGFPMLLLLGYAPIGLTANPATSNLTNTWVTLAALAVLFIVMNVILFRREIFGKKSKQISE
jgi:ESS family glutamate:Na+ symporter